MIFERDWPDRFGLTEARDAIWHSGIGCHLVTMTYDWPTRCGILVVAKDEHADADRAIRFFQTVDPDVTHVITSYGPHEELTDTIHLKVDNQWVPFPYAKINTRPVM